MDWQQIKTEYITTDTSYRKLAQKYGVSAQAICTKSKQEGWLELREQFKNKTLTKTVEKVAEKKAKQAAKVTDLADKLLEKLEQAIDELDLTVTTHKIKTETGNTERTAEYKTATPGGMVDRAGLRQLSSVLRDLQAVKGEITDLERKEREARIDALRRSSMTGDGDDDETGIILLPPRREATENG